jgi:putative transposase
MGRSQHVSLCSHTQMLASISRKSRRNFENRATRTAVLANLPPPLSLPAVPWAACPPLPAMARIPAMQPPPGRRRKIKHYHEPGDVHELTFSCNDRRPLLVLDTWRKLLAEAIDRANERHEFRLVAFVFMPAHVHLLVLPNPQHPAIDDYLYAIKRPYSYRIKQLLATASSTLLAELTEWERRKSKFTFRYWEKGPGYDRNLQTEDAVMSAIEYFHFNPVRRGLCASVADWKWSSARWYLRDKEIDPDLPKLHGLPAEFFDPRCRQKI